MRKINIANYDVEVTESPSGNKKNIPFQVKESLIQILFAPALRLNGIKLLENNELAAKIRDCKEDFILLEESEYTTIVKAINAIEGLGKNEVDLVERILKAEKTEVAPK